MILKKAASSATVVAIALLGAATLGYSYVGDLRVTTLWPDVVATAPAPQTVYEPRPPQSVTRLDGIVISFHRDWSVMRDLGLSQLAAAVVTWILMRHGQDGGRHDQASV